MARNTILNLDRYERLPLAIPGAAAYYHSDNQHPGGESGRWDTANVEADTADALRKAIATLERQGWSTWFANDEYAHLFRPRAD